MKLTSSWFFVRTCYERAFLFFSHWVYAYNVFFYLFAYPDRPCLSNSLHPGVICVRLNYTYVSVNWALRNLSMEAMAADFHDGLCGITLSVALSIK
jgi:hypothetical protein